MFRHLQAALASAILWEAGWAVCGLRRERKSVLTTEITRYTCLINKKRWRYTHSFIKSILPTDKQTLWKRTRSTKSIDDITARSSRERLDAGCSWLSQRRQVTQAGYVRGLLKDLILLFIKRSLVYYPADYPGEATLKNEQRFSFLSSLPFSYSILIFVWSSYNHHHSDYSAIMWYLWFFYWHADNGF